jgi:RNA polymerase sigma-70 factor (ECF subfamily)
MAKVIQGAASLHSSVEGPTSASESAKLALADFQAVYREHYPAIWRFVRHLGVRPSDVPDVTHNVFLVAYRKRDTFEGRSTVRTWLCAIALRCSRDNLKSAAVRREVSVAEHPLESSPEATTEQYDAGELALAHRLLAALPQEQREVFVLHELEQMSGSEIASLMGTSLGTVRSRLRRAREAFRKQLENLKQRGALHG